MKTVLFVQGLGMTKHEWRGSFDEIAARLQSTGFNTVQFDLPIFDENGKCRELPLTKRAKLVEEAAAKCRPDGVLAQSYGATTALVASLPTVKTRLFISPAPNPKQNITNVYEEKGVKINYQGDTSLPRSSGENTTVGKEFWRDIENFDERKLAGNITSPVCILHGDRDTKISALEINDFFKMITATKKKLKIYPGGDHGLVDIPRPLREEVLRDTVTWFKETL